MFDKVDALGAAELIRTKKLSAKELLHGTLARLHELNGRLNAITDFYDDAPPASDGPFSGVPFVIKHLMADCGGKVTTVGSRFFGHQPAAVDDADGVAEFLHLAHDVR